MAFTLVSARKGVCGRIDAKRYTRSCRRMKSRSGGRVTGHTKEAYLAQVPVKNSETVLTPRQAMWPQVVVGGGG